MSDELAKIAAAALRQGVLEGRQPCEPGMMYLAGILVGCGRDDELSSLEAHLAAVLAIKAHPKADPKPG